MTFTVQDHFFRKAKKHHYLARAVYKLEEIQKRFKILKAGDRVLDLGAAPGSWIQLAGEIVGGAGLIVAIDLKPIEHSFPKFVVTVQGDIYDQGFVETVLHDHVPFNVVLSDMAPSTSGIKAADSARSALLFERAFEVGLWALAPGGTFLAKLFHGSDFHRLLAEAKKHFSQTRVVRPEATRKQSKEIYILALNKKT
ncbi:MAG: RlmE family RNA methyltransferase [Syntrophobacteraceae bacterium]|nr:RlmE family RNA methyltransferase [Syntrophobacteraceae bacterium]